MIDYIKLLNENDLNNQIIIITLFIVFAIVISFVIYFAFSYSYSDSVVDIFFFLITFVLLTGFYYAHFEIDTKENLARVAQYNVKSLKNLENNIEIINEKNPYLEKSEVNKILNEFYNPRGNKIEYSEILKELKN